MNRLLIGVMLFVGCTHVPAVELAPECYRYYEFFNAEGLTYEEVGKIADKMHEKNCWPAMQGLLDTEPIAPEVMLPDIVNCNTLAQHIVQMTVNRATADSPALMKLEGGNLTTDACVQISIGNPLYGEFLDSCTALGEITFGSITLASTAATTDKVINCLGLGRFPYVKKAVNYYLQRDSTGGEFIGYVLP